MAIVTTVTCNSHKELLCGYTNTTMSGKQTTKGTGCSLANLDNVALFEALPAPVQSRVRWSPRLDLEAQGGRGLRATIATRKSQQDEEHSNKHVLGWKVRKQDRGYHLVDDGCRKATSFSKSPPIDEPTII